MKTIIILCVVGILASGSFYRTSAQDLNKMLSTGKSLTTDVSKLLSGISKDSKKLKGQVSNAMKSGALETATGNSIISSLGKITGSADRLYQGVKSGKNISTMSGDVSTLLTEANTVDKLVGGVPGLKEVNTTWNFVEQQINQLKPLTKK